MDNLTVLITGVGSTTGISVLKGLRQQDRFNVRVIGTDINPSNIIAGSSFCDAFYSVPNALDPKYIPTLLDICKEEQVKVLIPIIDSELIVIADNKNKFEDHQVVVIISSSNTVRICNDKLATSEFFLQNGIPSPKTWLADGITTLNDLQFPVFVKPRDGVSSKNAFRIDSYDELVWAKERIPNLIIQEYLEGDEYTTDVFVNQDGYAIAVVPRQRLDIRAGISYKGRTCHDHRLIRWGKTIAEALNICGPANIQCMVSGDNIGYFEVNPRFSGSLPLTIAAGVNSPLLAVRMACGEKIPNEVMVFKSVIMTRYWSEIFRHAKSN